MAKKGLRPMAWLKERAPGLHRFLTSHEGKVPLLRDLVGIVLVLVLMMTALWGFTGQSFPDEAPVVVVESGSMMHCANGIGRYYEAPGGGGACDPRRYGRIGTIDPGDLIFVRDVPSASGASPKGVETFAAGGDEHYWEPGDVIIFRPNGQPSTPIIHRAMFWLEVHGDGTFSVPELGVARTRELTLESLGIDRTEYRIVGPCQVDATAHGRSLGPEDSGWITKGDNNDCFDQSTRQQAMMPVRPEWLLGKARGEVPWIGLIKLKISDWQSGSENYARAPADVRTMLWVAIVVFVAAPFLVEFGLRRLRARRAKARDEDEAVGRPRASEGEAGTDGTGGSRDGGAAEDAAPDERD